MNTALKKILGVWHDYLMTPDSASHLGTDDQSWFSSVALTDLTDVANVGQDKHTFAQLYECDPAKEHHGFKSWDDFFTRVYREGIRPVASPEDDNVVANACESQTYNVAHDVGRRSKFWVKGQPYSVVDMLAQDELAEAFVGGTIYQAFLSALSYHRWHSPVSGKIIKTLNIAG